MFDLGDAKDASTNIDMKHKREFYSELLLDSLLQKKEPEIEILKNLYLKEHFSFVINEIEDFLINMPEDLVFREPKNINETEIYLKKRQIGKEPFYQAIASALGSWKNPDIDDLRKLYGDYSEDVLKQFSDFNNIRKERSCDLPYTLHLLRSSGMSHSLKYDPDEDKPDKYHNTLWSVHDSVEDLLYSLKDTRNNHIYGLENISKFLDNYIPEDHHKNILLVTNTSDLILKYLKNIRKSNVYSKKGLNNALNKMNNHIKDKHVSLYTRKMLSSLGQFNDVDEEHFFEDVKWHFYKNVFLKGLAEQSLKTNEPKVLEGKGVIDLYDNFVGRHARDLRDRRRSILKMVEWASISNAYASNFSDKQKEILLDRTNQVMIHANYGARELIVQYLSQPVALQDHLKSALTSIKELQGALYKKKE